VKSNDADHQEGKEVEEEKPSEVNKIMHPQPQLPQNNPLKHLRRHPQLRHPLRHLPTLRCALVLKEIIAKEMDHVLG